VSERAARDSVPFFRVANRSPPFSSVHRTSQLSFTPAGLTRPSRARLAIGRSFLAKECFALPHVCCVNPQWRPGTYPNHLYLIHACLVHTSHAPAPAPLTSAAITEITLRDPQRWMPETQSAFSHSESPPRSSHPACKSPSTSTSRLAFCAPAPVFILTSKRSWTVGRKKKRTPFSSNDVWAPGNQAIIVALKVADDTATCHACHRRRCRLCSQRLESRNSVFRDKIVRNSMHCHTVCSQFILSISAITGMAITFFCPWTALSHYEAMKPRDSDLHSLER
jgi:hypothetical protein